MRSHIMIALGIVAIATVAKAEVFYFENFDNLPLGEIAGPIGFSDPINGMMWKNDQAGLGEVTDEDSFSPGQSFNITRFVDGGRIKNSTQMNPVAELPLLIWADEWFKHLPSNNQGGSRELFRIGADTDAEPLIAKIFIDSDLKLKAQTSNIPTPVDFTSNEWHHLALKIDGNTALVDVWLDEELIWDDLNFNGAPAGSTVGVLGHNSKFHNEEERLFLDNIRIADVSPFAEPLTGDMDCDGDIDFDDIDDFVLGLNNPVQYESDRGVPASLKGDTDGDGDLDFDDITGFVGLLSGGGGVGAVPEPTTLLLAVLGALGVVCYRWRKLRG